MSKNNSEDYLDELLNSVAQPSAKKSNAALSEFDIEELEGLSEYDVDEFLKEFEKDISSTIGNSIKDGRVDYPKQVLSDNSKDYFSRENKSSMEIGGLDAANMEEASNNYVKDESSHSEEQGTFIENSTIEEDSDMVEELDLGDNGETSISESEDRIEDTNTSDLSSETIEEASVENQEDSDSIASIAEEDEDTEKERSEGQIEPVEVRELDDQDVIEMLSNMSDDDDLAEIGEMLKKEENNEPIEDSLGEVGIEMNELEMESMIREFSSDSKTKSVDDDPKEKKSKVSLFTKIYRFFVGDEAEEEEELPEKVVDENSQILEEMNEEENGDKKKKKKEKKPKKVKEPKQPKAPKAPKEKKPKPEKEASNLKPLPKKPIILIGVMCASIMVLVIMGVNMLSYKSNISMSKEKFNAGNYVEAYSDIVGTSISKSDEEYFMKVKVLSILQKEIYSYEALYNSKMYNEALDSLIKGVERFDNNITKAEELKVSDRMLIMETELENQLQLRFGISLEKAKELYLIENQLEYSNEIYSIVKEAGLIEGE